MKRTVKAWVVVNKRGRIPFTDPIHSIDGPISPKRYDVESWGNQPGDRIVRGLITFDDGKPARRKGRAK